MTPSAYRKDWNRFAVDVLNQKLDSEQRQILAGIQDNRRVAVASGNARGKDKLAAVAAVSFLHLYAPCRVICTAPTGRQAISIVMAEISKIYEQACPLGGTILADRIKFPDKDHYLLSFKAADRSQEAWTGFHHKNIMVIVTEASGIEQRVFDSIERILTGVNVRYLLVFNPNSIKGETYECSKSPLYKFYRLNSLNAPNVKAKKVIYPGQVDWSWIDEKIHKPGWVRQIDKSEYRKDFHDFEWEGQWYRPENITRVSILGEYPLEDEDQLIPLRWVENAIDRWREMKRPNEPLKLGVDVAGMGRDSTVFCYRYDNYVEKFVSLAKTKHTETAGRIKQELEFENDIAFVDIDGEGAGVGHINEENNVNFVGVDFRRSAKGLTDFTGARKFLNMRAWCWWAIRDALDPQFGINLALPDVPELKQDLTEPKYFYRSDGSIYIEEKDKIKARLGRSPDFGDALACSFAPYFKQSQHGRYSGVIVR